MSQQQAQTVQVIQKNEGCLSGCGTIFAVAVVIALIVTYWYVAIPVAVLAAAAGLYFWNRQRQQLPPPQAGPLDPWLNQLATRLSVKGYAEQTRNTGPQLEGIPMEGDLVVEGEGMRIYLNVFSDDYAAGRAASKLRGRADVQQAMVAAQSAVLSHGRMLVLARPLAGSLDTDRVENVMELVADMPPPSAPREPERAALPRPDPDPAPQAQADALEQLQKLGDLRDKGIVTPEEFEAKKAELLKRL